MLIKQIGRKFPAIVVRRDGGFSIMIGQNACQSSSLRTDGQCVHAWPKIKTCWINAHLCTNMVDSCYQHQPSQKSLSVYHFSSITSEGIFDRTSQQGSQINYIWGNKLSKVVPSQLKGSSAGHYGMRPVNHEPALTSFKLTPQSSRALLKMLIKYVKCSSQLNNGGMDC